MKLTVTGGVIHEVGDVDLEGPSIEVCECDTLRRQAARVVRGLDDGLDTDGIPADMVEDKLDEAAEDLFKHWCRCDVEARAEVQECERAILKEMNIA